jgi:hypothetical protein
MMRSALVSGSLSSAIATAELFPDGANFFRIIHAGGSGAEVASGNRLRTDRSA